MSTAHGIETEVKIRLTSLAAAHRKLSEVGFAISVPRRFESNTVYDTPDLNLKGAQTLLRLRQTGTEAVITWKGASIPSEHKTRPELETSVGSLETLDQILRALGYEPSFRYEKYRTEYEHKDFPDGTVTLDETPIGDFFELEGAPDWIDQTAALLGFERDEYVLLSYSRLYLEFCAEHHVEPANMLFPRAS